MRLITLNGVKLLAYRNGMILRYSETTNSKYVKKGWNVCNGWMRVDYKVIELNHKPYSLHRIIAFAFLGLDINNTKQIIDHIDRNPLNNNLNNLRIVTSQENNFNTNSKGYRWNEKNKRYVSYIRHNRKLIYLGCYDNEEEARQAYLDGKAKYHIIQSSNNSNDNVNEYANSGV